jgi:hypothetical protein
VFVLREDGRKSSETDWLPNVSERRRWEWIKGNAREKIKENVTRKSTNERGKIKGTLTSKRI